MRFAIEVIVKALRNELIVNNSHCATIQGHCILMLSCHINIEIHAAECNSLQNQARVLFSLPTLNPKCLYSIEFVLYIHKHLNRNNESSFCQSIIKGFLRFCNNVKKNRIKGRTIFCDELKINIKHMSSWFKPSG